MNCDASTLPDALDIRAEIKRLSRPSLCASTVDVGLIARLCECGKAFYGPGVELNLVNLDRPWSSTWTKHAAQPAAGMELNLERGRGSTPMC